MVGPIYVDIREYYGRDDYLKPGRKGITLTEEQACVYPAHA